MSHQITKVDLIPNGELSVCNVSQFDNGRVLPFEILENKEAYNIPNDIRVELHCRKPDGNIVTLPSESIADNIVTFLSTTQLTACYGKNICEIALYGPNDYLIGSANFILEVEKSPTLGGINSTTAIHNLESQIKDIAEDVIPEILPDYLEDYYTKSEVDALIDNIFPTLTASGAIASFVTALTKPLVSVIADEGASAITRCGVNLFDKDSFVVNNSTYFEIANDGSVQTKSNNVTDILLWSNTKRKSGAITITWRSKYEQTGSVGLRPKILYTDGTTATIYPTNSQDYHTETFTTYNNRTVDRIVTDYGTFVNKTNFYMQVEFGSAASEYHPYTGNTVPAAEATTLETLSGVNNVFADVGDVTVGYKYMPMPETPNNSNRLLLSSVNSDIIKEKTEIKDQSDIIEDIERGEENE